MNNILRQTCIVGITVIGLVLLSANAAGQEAHIRKIVGTGTATVTIAGHSQPATQDMAVPVEAVIQTTGQEVYLEVVPGVVASVKPNTRVTIQALAGDAPELFLGQGDLVSEIDTLKGKHLKVHTAHGVAAARGTSFSVSVDGGGTETIATTADSVEFTSSDGSKITIRAGMVSFTPAGATQPGAPMPLATAIQSNSAVAGLINEAVNTAATVVKNNIGSISAESATNIAAQVVAVAVAAAPQQATYYTSTVIGAVTAAGSATAGSADTAAGAITAAAIKSAPDQAAQIAGAAAAAAPGQAGVITAVAQQVAPAAKDSIAQSVAASTGQSTSTVQSNADASTATATNAISISNSATNNVVTPPASQPTTPSTKTTPETTPKIPVAEPDVSSAGGG